nr:uncharacterized protein LOC106683820 [Halyomorpha halys]
MEAEYISAGIAAQELVNLCGLISEFKCGEVSARLNVDNNSAIAQIKNPENSQRAKHIDIKHHFVKELVDNKKIGSGLHNQGIQSKTKAEAFLKQIGENFIPSQPHTLKTIDLNKNKVNLASPIICKLNETELDAALHGKRCTAPGLVENNYEMALLPRILKLQLLKAFNDPWETVNIPSDWRMVSIIPVSKPNRDPSLLSSLRPIAHISCLAKIFNIMIKHRLE